MDPRLLPWEGVRSLIAVLRRGGSRVVSSSLASEGEKEGFTGSAVIEEPSGPVALAERTGHVSS